MNIRRRRTGIAKLRGPRLTTRFDALIRILPTALLALLLVAPTAWSDAPLRLATTTTTVASGLMDYLLPKFTADTGIAVQTVAVGTGQALRLGRDGNVDVLLVHAREAEDAFVAAGHGVDRADVMFNDFVIVGPPTDPAGIGGSDSAPAALERIFDSEQPFVSRGDESGTHRREMKLWQAAGLAPAGSWYRQVGQGMGRALQIAGQMQAYALTDRGTWLAFRDKVPLALLFAANPPLANPYGIIAVNPARHPDANYASAVRLIEWITAPAAQQAIADFKIDGESLFHPAPKPAQ